MKTLAVRDRFVVLENALSFEMIQEDLDSIASIGFDLIMRIEDASFLKNVIDSQNRT